MLVKQKRVLRGWPQETQMFSGQFGLFCNDFYWTFSVSFALFWDDVDGNDMLSNGRMGNCFYMDAFARITEYRWERTSNSSIQVFT